MDYSFGDLFDLKAVPGVGHYVLVVGEAAPPGKAEVMYYMITSRVYAVFDELLKYFNGCLTRGDREFLKHFPKEKAKSAINPHGNLRQAMFLDHEDYKSVLSVDSMVVINSDPQLMDKAAMDNLNRDKKAVYRDRLTRSDANQLIQLIKHSRDVSQEKVVKISTAFNKVKPLL